jgi:predicted N-acyltransferase
MGQGPTSAYTLSWIQNIAEIHRDEWDALAKPLPTPFLEWDWLRLMERSGSTTAKNGWLPYHLTVRRGPDLVAAAPMYIKGHSAGEFVFDHVWADVATRLGIAYYPKIVGMSPFTPMSGYRFLIAPGEDAAGLTAAMLDAIDQLCRRHNLSGSSFLFVDPQWRDEILEMGYFGWQHQSYSWFNRGYETFDDYLALFNANQRRNIKRERRAMDKQGIVIKILTGDDIPRSHFDLMYRFYEHTNDKFGPWGCRYLTESFFEGLHDRFRHRLVFIAAYDSRAATLPVGMSMLVTKDKSLYGRYWGSTQKFDSLHFNACYYEPIEWAINHGIQRFDPGMGGAHKIRRGFTSLPSYSLHRFSDPRLLQIMQNHIDEINRLEQEQIDALNAELPFARRELEN